MIRLALGQVIYLYGLLHFLRSSFKYIVGEHNGYLSIIYHKILVVLK